MHPEGKATFQRPIKLTCATTSVKLWDSDFPQRGPHIHFTPYGRALLELYL